MRRSIGCAPRANTGLAITTAIVLAGPAALADRQDQPHLPTDPVRVQAKLSGSFLDFNAASAQTAAVSGNHVVLRNLGATYICRTYQGKVKEVFLKVAEGNANLEVRTSSIPPAERTQRKFYHWPDVKLMTLTRARDACRGRTDVVTLRTVIDLKNSCGTQARHYRNGSGVVLLQLQCSASSVKPKVTPIRWRYECTGENMFIEGTRHRSVERDRPDDNVKCIYQGR